MKLVRPNLGVGRTNSMAKTAEKKAVKKISNLCECGEEMKWVKYANNNRYYWFCTKCDKLVDRKGKVKESK
jgi:hypothetical protein